VKQFLPKNQNMGVTDFSDFQTEIEKKNFKNPKIKFGFQSIKIITLPYFDDILLQFFLGIVSILPLFNSSLLFVGLLFIVISFYFFYVNFIGLNICSIDFTSKNIVFKNRFFILNFFRKLFRTKTKINFSEIKTIDFKEGTLLGRFGGVNWKCRYHLLIETYNDPAVIISQFKKQDDVVNIVSLLNKFILNKKNIA
jgi:hypothetical protein